MISPAGALEQRVLQQQHRVVVRLLERRADQGRVGRDKQVVEFGLAAGHRRGVGDKVFQPVHVRRHAQGILFVSADFG